LSRGDDPATTSRSTEDAQGGGHTLNDAGRALGFSVEGMSSMASIRMADLSDGASVADVYGPYVSEAATSFELEPPSPAEMSRRIEAVLGWAPWLVCQDDGGQVLGYAYASRHAERAAYQWSVDLAVYIHRQHHRRGVGRALYDRLFALLRLQGFYVAHAGITLPNTGSVALHEGLGFRPVGIYPAVGWKLGTWRDVGWWQLPLQPRPATPRAPVPLPQATALPGWREALDPARPVALEEPSLGASPRT
jgi:L-amino acid N-acyltransferase YncA